MQVFNEKQVGAILKRAAELQSGDSAPGVGLTLDELRAVAEETGLDPRHIEQAAREIYQSAAPPRAGFAFWGTPARLTEERVLAQHVDEDEWGEMVEEMQRQFGEVGVVSAAGATRTWSHTGHHGRTTTALSVTQRRGHLHLVAQRNMRQTIALTFGPAGAVVLNLVMMLATGEVFPIAFPFNLVVAAVLLTVAFFALRGVAGHFGRKEAGKLKAALDRAEQIAGESEGLETPSEGLETPSAAPAAPILPLGESFPEAPPLSPSPRLRTR